ncbi:MAG: transposase [Burkholderia sp.]
MLAQPMSFTAVARTVGESWHRVHAICKRYVELALVADARERKVVFVTEGKDAATIEAFVASLREHGGPSRSRRSALTGRPCSSKASRRTCRRLASPFDKFHVIAHAAKAVDPMRRIEQRTDPELNRLDGRC